MYRSYEDPARTLNQLLPEIQENCYNNVGDSGNFGGNFGCNNLSYDIWQPNNINYFGNNGYNCTRGQHTHNNYDCCHNISHNIGNNNQFCNRFAPYQIYPNQSSPLNSLNSSNSLITSQVARCVESVDCNKRVTTHTSDTSDTSGTTDTKGTQIATIGYYDNFDNNVNCINVNNINNINNINNVCNYERDKSKNGVRNLRDVRYDTMSGVRCTVS